jgi:hypothetical protein
VVSETVVAVAAATGGREDGRDQYSDGLSWEACIALCALCEELEGAHRDESDGRNVYRTEWHSS